jgi:hypothetical protein
LLSGDDHQLTTITAEHATKALRKHLQSILVNT